MRLAQIVNFTMNTAVTQEHVTIGPEPADVLLWQHNNCNDILNPGLDLHSLHITLIEIFSAIEGTAENKVATSVRP